MTFDGTWRSALLHVLLEGNLIAPRGLPTREVRHLAARVDMAHPVLVQPERKLSYRFMAAEALWVLNGDDHLAPLTAHNPRMAAYSDDGVTLAGAYGPRVIAQLPYVVDALRRDPDTRQATLTTWVPSPAPSKDVPCTVAINFQLRDDVLHAHVFMRSSDLWLGLPYDVFTFTMVAARVVAELNATRPTPLTLGTLYVTAASSHLYQTNWDAARAVLRVPLPPPGPALPAAWLRSPVALMAGLDGLLASKRGDAARWWAA